MANVFVFGSNYAGRHGKGAAKEALNKWGAVYGIGHGRVGNSYAIPTKDEHLNVVELKYIEGYIEEFLNHAEENPDDLFITTPIGTGLAGYSISEIKDIFQNNFDVPMNVVFTKDWFKNG